jgi:subtilisin-like proprotein convertase family protein
MARISSLTLAFVLGLLLLFALNVSGDVPQLINYQAKITDSGGNPVNGTYSVAFKIYGVASGGTALWTETHPSISITNGNLYVLLGSVTTIPLDLFDSPDRWLGVKIGTDPEMTPRKQIASGAYSFVAHKAQEMHTCPPQSFPSTDTPISSEYGPITSNISVTGGPSSISNVTADIDFNPAGEVLSMTLTSPNATVVTLYSVGFPGSIVGNYDKDFWPAQGSMGDFVGENANGTWTLQISLGTGISGDKTLNSWQLNFDECTCGCDFGEFGKVTANNLVSRQVRLLDSSDNVSFILNGDNGALQIGNVSGISPSIHLLNASGNTVFRGDSNAQIGSTSVIGNLTVYGTGPTSAFSVNGYQNIAATRGKFQLYEITEPSAPPADSAYLYVKDNGSGKTQLCVKFSSGSPVVIATQP